MCSNSLGAGLGIAFLRSLGPLIAILAIMVKLCRGAFHLVFLMANYSGYNDNVGSEFSQKYVEDLPVLDRNLTSLDLCGQGNPPTIGSNDAGFDLIPS